MSKVTSPTQEEKELASLGAQIEKLLEPDRKLEAERQERLAKVEELRKRQEELQAARDLKQRREELATVLKQRLEARADLEAKQAAWLDLMAKAHQAHKECLQASIFESNVGHKLERGLRAEHSELQEVCAEIRIDYEAACRNLLTMRYTMSDDLMRFYEPACRPHQLKPEE